MSSGQRPFNRLLREIEDAEQFLAFGLANERQNILRRVEEHDRTAKKRRVTLSPGEHLAVTRQD